MALLLALDGGQTGTRALLARADGTVLGSGRAGPIRHLFAGGGEEARAAIHAAVLGAYAAAGSEPGLVEAVICGITSVQPDSMEAAAVERFLHDVVHPARVRVVPDYVTNLAGASDGGCGVVVAAGGGSVAYGRSEKGEEAVAGGFGYLLGDEGSGFDIGRRAIGAAIHAYDGRGPATALTGIVCRAYGLADLSEIKRVVYVPQVPREQIAALVPDVVRAAEAEDGVARSILCGAGHDLARLALAVIRRLYSDGDAVGVYPAGGVFAAGTFLTEPFRANLAAHWPGARVRAPQHSALVGALILAQSLLAG